MATLPGGNYDDIITGTNGGDFIDGGNGDDVLMGGNGADSILGGEGRDARGARPVIKAPARAGGGGGGSPLPGSVQRPVRRRGRGGCRPDPLHRLRLSA